MDGARSTATRRSARELLSFIAGFFVVWTVRATYLCAIDSAIASVALRTVYSLVVKPLLWGVFLLSLLAGWLYLESASFWPPALTHIANNCLAVVFIG